jgi:solute carrier family 25 carnitine/acylcarnitine transporter 20/29
MRTATAKFITRVALLFHHAPPIHSPRRLCTHLCICLSNPTHDAIKRHSLTHPLWHSVLNDDSFLLTDNVQEQLRQQLFYHLLNYSLPVSSVDNDVQVHKTLLFPRNPSGSPSREPPWMPSPGGTLGGEPQRLRLASHGEEVRVGVDSFGKGGVKIVKGQQDAGNGVLLGIEDVLEPPPDLCK